jgi:hypothetical protein
VLVYEDDLMLLAKNPKVFFDLLINDHGFQLKCVGSFHTIWAWESSSDAEKTIMCYEAKFENQHKNYNTPMDERHHHELDNTDLLDGAGINQYRSLVFNG